MALTRLKVLQFARRRKRARGKTTESRETIKNNSVTARARGSCGFPCRLREQTSTRASVFQPQSTTWRSFKVNMIDCSEVCSRNTSIFTDSCLTPGMWDKAHLTLSHCCIISALPVPPTSERLETLQQCATWWENKCSTMTIVGFCSHKHSREICFYIYVILHCQHGLAGQTTTNILSELWSCLV